MAASNPKRASNFSVMNESYNGANCRRRGVDIYLKTPRIPMSEREDVMSRSNRRSFLKGAAAVGAAGLVPGSKPARAQEAGSARASAPSAAARQAESGPPAVEVLTGD